MRNLLTVGGDVKTVKGQKIGILTGIMYFAPHTISGFQVCPKATKGCINGCLFTAGRGVYDNVKLSRINKTKMFFNHRAEFLTMLVRDIGRLERRAKKKGMIPAVRLNGTSDIAWEKIRIIKDGKIFRNVMEAFPKVNFYDYTKIKGRKAALALRNYSLTFSLSENNDKDALEALHEGYNVAVVMEQGKKSAPKPKKWSGFTVLDGDETDVRFMDKRARKGRKGYIVALAAKGKARKDKSGWVRHVGETFRV